MQTKVDLRFINWLGILHLILSTIAFVLQIVVAVQVARWNIEFTHVTSWQHYSFTAAFLVLSTLFIQLRASSNISQVCTAVENCFERLPTDLLHFIMLSPEELDTRIEWRDVFMFIVNIVSAALTGMLSLIVWGDITVSDLEAGALAVETVTAVISPQIIEDEARKATILILYITLTILGCAVTVLSFCVISSLLLLSDGCWADCAQTVVKLRCLGELRFLLVTPDDTNECPEAAWLAERLFVQDLSRLNASQLEQLRDLLSSGQLDEYCTSNGLYVEDAKQFVSFACERMNLQSMAAERTTTSLAISQL